MEKLRFSTGNAKLRDGATLVFSVPAGHTCPGARDCKSLVHPDGGHLITGPHAKFTCFAAAEERRLKNVRASRWHNYGALINAGTRAGMASLIGKGIDRRRKTRFVRIHASGDFFSEDYFKAWMDVAAARPGILFYAYTKSLKFWVSNMDLVPDNMVLTASEGGTMDKLIDLHSLKSVKVVFHPEEAGDLPLDHDDSYARAPRVSFALLLHSVQPAGSKAAKAKIRMTREGVRFGYAGGKP